MYVPGGEARQSEEGKLPHKILILPIVVDMDTEKEEECAPITHEEVITPEDIAWCKEEAGF